MALCPSHCSIRAPGSFTCKLTASGGGRRDGGGVPNTQMGTLFPIMASRFCSHSDRGCHGVGRRLHLGLGTQRKQPLSPTESGSRFKLGPLQSLVGRGQSHRTAAYMEVAGSSNEQGAALPADEPQSLSSLREQFCCPGVEFQEVSGVALAVLKLAEGSSVRLTLEGARVIAWKAVMYHKGKEDLIFSKVNRMQSEGSGWLRGGIPISFPAAGGGVAGVASDGGDSVANLIRGMPWRVVSTWSDGDAFAEIVMRLEDSAATRAVWPHSFQLRYSVHQMPTRLVSVLHVHNPGPTPFSFAASVDSHLAVVDPAGAQVMGLEGTKYLARTELNRNYKGKGAEKQQDVPLGKRIERIYCNAPANVSLFDRGGYRTLALVKEGFNDVLVVSPGTSSVEEESFVCLGAANSNRVTLAPGQSWEGRQSIELES